jgi:hypothetical protein
MRALTPLLLSIALTTFVGCREEVRHASELEKLARTASRIMLYSLEPSARHGDATHNERVFHGFGIIGRAEITDPAERRALLQAIAESVRRPPDMVAACFNPRHALSIQDGSRTVDLTICFECHQMRADGFAGDKGLVISPAQEPTFDQALQRHGLRKSKT